MSPDYTDVLEQHRVDMTYEHLAKALDLIANAGTELMRAEVIRPSTDSFMGDTCDKLGAIWTELKEHFREDAENQLESLRRKQREMTISEIINSFGSQGVLATDC